MILKKKPRSDVMLFDYMWVHMQKFRHFGAKKKKVTQNIT